MPNTLSRMILENIGDGILSVDSSFKVVFANKVACEILMVDPTSIIGRSVYEILSLCIYDESAHDEKSIDPFGVAMLTGKQTTYSTPMRINSIKSDSIYVEDTVSPIHNSEGEILGSVMIFRNVTEKVRTEAMLRHSNQRYQILFDNIKSGIAVYESHDGETFHIVDFNLAAEQIEGVDKSEIIGKNIQDVFPGVESFGLMAILRNVWKTGKSEHISCSFYKDNVRRGWRDNYVYKFPTGEVVAVYDDVTQKKNKAERLSESIGTLRDNEQRFRGMFENSSVGVVISGDPPNYPILQINNVFCQFLGYNKIEMLGKTILDITHPEDIDLSLVKINESRNKIPAGKPVKLVKRYIKKDGSIIVCEVYLSKIEYGDGRIEHFAQIVDITDRKRAEDEKILLAKVVAELNSADVKNRDTIKNIMLSIKHFAKLDAVAVRLPDRIGFHNQFNDYPFYFHDGFTKEFINNENSLCCHNDNDDFTINNEKCLECICGAVITKEFKKDKTFFTEGGSFWTNSTTNLISKGIHAIPAIRPRMACWKNGFESVAVVPIVCGDQIIGSMLLSAKKENVLDERMVDFFEEVGKSMGVAFSRMQMMSDVENHRRALARANDILSVECDVAKNLANGSDNNLDSVLTRSGKKLGVKWLCVIVIGNGEIIGKWTDEKFTSGTMISHDIQVGAHDLQELKKWIFDKKPYIGRQIDMPTCLVRISKPLDGQWIAIPVNGENLQSPTGIVIMVTRSEKEWSKDECEAMNGLSTLLCILAKVEKNRMELSRKIEETILIMNRSVTPPTAGEKDAQRK